MKLITFIASILFFNQIVHAEFPYETLDSTYTSNGIIKEIFPSTPVKSQDGVGLCYGFAATSLLEHYRCKELDIPCTDSKDILSSLDVTSYEENRSEKILKEGGMPSFILHNIANSNRKLAREECASFSSLIHEIIFENKKYKSEKIGWDFLSQGWNNFKSRKIQGKSNDCITCMADNIKAALVNIKTPSEQIKEALDKSNSAEEFLFRTLLPVHCLQEKETLEIPPFVVKTFPTFRDPQDDQSLQNKVMSLLNSGTPLEINICSNKNKEDCGGHAVTLFGLKEVCSKVHKDCKKMVKVKNSYGNSWQQQTNDGWVELKTLIESSINYNRGNNLVWIEKPN